jgi:hypothetical protein
LSDLIAFLRDNWITLRSAPAAFALLVVIAFSAAFFVGRWRYEAVIEQLRERLTTHKERIDAKSEQLDEYRQRLHLIPADSTSFTHKTNAELQRQALKVVQEIRDFLKQRQVGSYSVVLSRPSAKPGLTEEQRHQEWERETQAMMRDSLETSTGYDSRFKVDTILLRDEILSRLPANAKNEREFRTYEHPTNPIGMGMVADDLERLAKSLPVKPGARDV